MICDTCKYMNNYRNKHPCSECKQYYTGSKYESISKADTERHAHWIRINDILSQCSNCKTNILSCDTDNYCSHCGCKMDEVSK